MLENSPFDLDNNDSFARWRDIKLRNHPSSLEELIVEIADLHQLTSSEHQAVLSRVDSCGMAIYASSNSEIADKSLIRDLGRQFGLQHLDDNMGADDDAISSLTVQKDALHRGYIPYTDRPIAWHTDGYYNLLEQQIYGLLLHCVEPAVEGGANRLLDHEVLYLQLRELNPAFIEALQHPEAMTIPANEIDGKILRPARSGPVFMVRPDGRLHMRYTDRTRSIEWRDDPLTQEAVSTLKQLLKSDSPYHFEGTLQSGQGLISSNVLHTRERFDNGEPQRLLYRARYFDAISGISS
ncbi:MAG: TauD/TfdA family dioxygenase [Candidatus Sedimenticola sp. (ex Thyasira tokunagai)]